MKFEWDEMKNAENIKNHGVDFNEAKTVFNDAFAIITYDKKHSDIHSEERFHIIGISDKANLLLVCHCYKDNDETIRLISAWKATTTEKNIYLGGHNG